MSDLGEGQNRLPDAVRGKFLTCIHMSIILLLWMLYLSSDAVISAVPLSYWNWYTRGESLRTGFTYPVEARLYYAPWVMLVAALLVCGDILLLVAAFLSILLGSKGASGRSAGVEVEVLPPLHTMLPQTSLYM
jgi:hypothetical protein